MKGESFSLKVFANLINSLNFNQVTVVDPHSDVVDGVFNKINIIKQIDIINKYEKFANRVSNGNGALFVAPDAGANKKVSEVAKYFGHTKFVRADKLRNLSTGQILETIIYHDNFEGRDVIIIDDLIDAGGTFLGLAKVCKEKNCGKFILYCTHGIFSKGTKYLFENGLDEIFSTNSFWDVWPAGVDNVNTFNVENLIK